MKNLAIITARGGSKRIPRKNIKEFMGKPMIAYAIDACIKANIFDEIMVSTDDDEIASIAKNLGAKVPFMRSIKNSDDYATTNDVLIEVVDKYRSLGKNPSVICCVYPCVPFLNGDILRDAYDKFISSGADGLTPVVKFSFPIQRAFRIVDGFLRYNEPQNALKRSQDLEPMYHDAGMFYFHKTSNINSDNIMPYIIDESLAQDIDTMEDWNMAQIKFKVKNEL
ncbi:pseudaminic acid cytidylyltransferase [Campylobacter porcelli]|uniref:Pseudaminic acid cytidylyltransferase n=2 Tax=Campylobacter porcelli TaxID=1660073 RepID=A0ABU7M5D3_9BACT|nr:pseudaminic acid cytidylyltransferase [Campylobacter sp. RM6137]MEE3705189.1 pseudaminic acid cytidylyltransferase [Campylobacter sp. CX2-8023-23]MEE3744925.1 pseudaminic acid cytidylyltransferase [Campylobacter sp. CX2-4855-23]